MGEDPAVLVRTARPGAVRAYGDGVEPHPTVWSASRPDRGVGVKRPRHAAGVPLARRGRFGRCQTAVYACLLRKKDDLEDHPYILRKLLTNSDQKPPLYKFKKNLILRSICVMLLLTFLLN